MKSIFIISVFLTLAFPSFVIAQNAADEPYIISSNASGEENSAVIDRMRAKARQTGERLFIIAHLGTDETSRRVSLARLRAAKNYILPRGGFDSEPIIFAEGERVAGEGRIEYYLGSRLQLVTLAPKNKIPEFTCCRDYFAPAKRKPKKQGAYNKSLQRSAVQLVFHPSACVIVLSLSALAEFSRSAFLYPESC